MTAELGDSRLGLRFLVAAAVALAVLVVAGGCAPDDAAEPPPDDAAELDEPDRDAEPDPDDDGFDPEVVEPGADVDGEALFAANCASCHQRDASGAGDFPSLVDSDIVAADDPHEYIEVVTYGRELMPPYSHYGNEELAAILSYVRGLAGVDDPIAPDEVQAVRDAR